MTNKRIRDALSEITHAVEEPNDLPPEMYAALRTCQEVLLDKLLCPRREDSEIKRGCILQSYGEEAHEEH